MFKYEETAEMISVHEENVTDTCKTRMVHNKRNLYKYLNVCLLNIFFHSMTEL